MAQRTLKQNASLHIYFDLLAEELNKAGYDMKKTFKHDVDIPWTPLTVKEYLWKPIQKSYILKQSTTELNTKEIDKIYDILNKHLGEKTGVYVPFPSNETRKEL